MTHHFRWGVFSVELSTFWVTPCQDCNAEFLLRIKLGVKHHSRKEQRFLEFTSRRCERSEDYLGHAFFIMSITNALDAVVD